MLINGAQILSGGGSATQQTGPAPPDASAARRRIRPAVSSPLVLGDTEDRWTEIFTASGKTYHPPKLRLFHGREPTAAAAWRNRRWGRSTARATSASISIRRSSTTCRPSSAAAPTARPASSREAYVIAHEVGHHVQDELGILPRVTQAQQAAASKAEANALQVRIELQADCFAGVWANRAQQKHNFLDPGDVDQALQTASAIGDDRLQKQAQGYVVPDSFTHGTSEQRKRWFSNGFNGGQVSACDTMSASSL